MIATLLLATQLAFPLAEAVVYEANLRALGPKPGFETLRSRLGEIKGLGANVLWLMPIQPVGRLRSAGGFGSPYAVANYSAVNPEFGDEKSFRLLVKEAQSMGFAVVLDWVANHTAWDHPWVKQRPEWYTKNDKGEIVRPAGTNWNDVADLDFSKPALRTAMIDEMKGWIVKYGIDGFRCDAADYVPDDFWATAVPELRKAAKKPLLMIAEGGRTSHYKSGFDVSFGWPFCDALISVAKGASARNLPGVHAREIAELPPGGRRLRFITNHDKSAWDGTVAEQFGSVRAGELAFAVLSLYPGSVPLIYQGQEVGWPDRIPIFDHSTIDWSTGKANRKNLSDTLAARAACLAFRSGNLRDFSSEDVIAFARTAGRSQGLVLVNPRNEPRTVEIPTEFVGEWRTRSLPSTVTLAPMDLQIYWR